jgi:hypothetical protein
MAKKKFGTCTYCSRTRKLEPEHAFPKVLFRGRNQDPVTVPVCNDCNQEKSLGDRDLRNYVNIHIIGSKHVDARFHLDRMLVSNEATRRWLVTSARAATPVEFVTEAGLIIGESGEMEFNRKRINKAHRQVVRGLYYYETKNILDQRVPVAVREIDWRVAHDVLKGFKERDDLKFTVKGNDVAAWVSLFGLPGSHPDNSVWCLVFNGGVCFLGGTGIKALEIMGFDIESSEFRESRPIGPSGKEQVLVVAGSDGSIVDP